MHLFFFFFLSSRDDCISHGHSSARSDEKFCLVLVASETRCFSVSCFYLFIFFPLSRVTGLIGGRGLKIEHKQLDWTST